MSFEERFWQAWSAGLAALPHHRAAEVLSRPGGFEWRELAARAALAAEEYPA